MPKPVCLTDLGPVPEGTPVHFRIPRGREPDILLSVNEYGRYRMTILDDPCDRLATTTTGARTAESVTSFGRGPLIFVEVNIDGWYFTRPPIPDDIIGKCATLAKTIEQACRVLGRRYTMEFPFLQIELARKFERGRARLDVIADCLSSPCIHTLKKWKWGYMFYIRVDLGGSYHVYPHVGGPFQTLDEAYSAIDCDLKRREDPKMLTLQPEDSRVDYVVRQCLHWRDGTRKNSFKVDERRDEKRLLVQALVDKYSDYSGDPYELKDVVHYQLVRVRDSYEVTYHINFTTNSGSGEEDFFAEVTSKMGEHKLVVSCFCRVEPNDNGSCYGCKAKHPNAAVYSPGQPDACFPFGASFAASDTVHGECAKDEETIAEEKNLEDEEKKFEKKWKAEEKRLRLLYENMGYNKPGYLEEQMALVNCAGGEVVDGKYMWRGRTMSTCASTSAPEKDGPAPRRSSRERRPNPRYQ